MSLRLNKKMKIIIGFALSITALIMIACAVNNDNPKLQSQKSVAKWNYNYPQLVKIAGSAPINKKAAQNISVESEDVLLGKITNEFGIRDDVLTQILKTISANNESATIHAIRMEQYDQKVFTAANTKDAVNYAEKMGASMECLMKSFGMLNTHHLIMSISDMQQDTPARFERKQYVQQKLLGWQVIHDINGDCNAGNY